MQQEKVQQSHFTEQRTQIRGKKLQAKANLLIFNLT